MDTIACTIIELVSILTELLCIVDRLGISIAKCLACLSTILPTPLHCIVSSIFNGLADGAYAVAVVCSSVLKTWNDDINKICPCSFANVSNAVSATSSQINVLVGK